MSYAHHGHVLGKEGKKTVRRSSFNLSEAHRMQKNMISFCTWFDIEQIQRTSIDIVRPG